MDADLIRPSIAKPSVLVVDDSVTARQLVVSVVASSGYEVSEASSGEQCLEFVMERRPDIILLDVQLPGMNGLEVVRKIRETYSQVELPILLVTTHAGEDQTVLGFSAGANDYITKPINRRILIARLEAQVGLVRAQKQLRQIEEISARNVRLESIHKFVLGVSHVFNNIFATLQSSHDLLQHRVGDEKGRKVLTRLLSAVDRGKRFTKRIAGMVQDIRSPDGTDVGVIVPQIVDLQREFLNPGTRIRTDIESDLPRVELGELSLSNLLTNLLYNSIEACVQGGEIVIKAASKGEFVEFTVQDSGVGMSDEVKNRVFEPFFSTKSLDSAHEVSTLGRGLGLWNVFNLVRSASGRIQVESEQGKGTAVVFTLPVVRGRVPEGNTI